MPDGDVDYFNPAWLDLVDLLMRLFLMRPAKALERPPCRVG